MLNSCWKHTFGNGHRDQEGDNFSLRSCERPGTCNTERDRTCSGKKVLINVSGGRKPQAFGALFGAYARSDMVSRIVYVTEEDNFIIDFPVLSFNISPTKKLILELIMNGTAAVEAIAVKAGISKGMAYNHLRELRSMGYITDEEGYKITDSGRLAVI